MKVGEGSIPKNIFPGLLMKLQNTLKPENISSGFRASGIYLVNREMVLKRLPQLNRDIGGGSVSEVFNEAIAGILVKHCGQGDKKKMPRGKKITPGKEKQAKGFICNHCSCQKKLLKRNEPKSTYRYRVKFVAKQILFNTRQVMNQMLNQVRRKRQFTQF